MDEYTILKKKKQTNGFAATAILVAIAIVLLALVVFLFLLGRADKKKDSVDVNTTESSITETNGVDTVDENDNQECIVGSKEQVFNNNLKIIKDAAVSYWTNERLPQKVGETKKLTLKEMQDAKLVTSLVDSKGKKVDTSKTYVEVTKEKNEYVMKINLSGSDMEDYILIHLGCYDYCDGNVCEKQDEFEYEYKKTTSCTMSDWSNWGEWTTKRESTSNTKKEDIKVVTTKKTITDTKDAIKDPTTYNCDKYGKDYKLDGKYCVKTTTSKEVIDATPSDYSYVCESGYTLSGTKCEKTVTKTDTKDAIANPVTYNCNSYPGYTLNGTKCEKVVTVSETKDALANPVTYNCNSYPGYTLSGTNCVKTVTDTKAATKNATTYNCSAYPGYTLSGTNCVKTETTYATPVYDTKQQKEWYTCNKQECTTKTVMNAQGQMVPQTSCENRQTECYRYVDVEYISYYSCPEGWTQNGYSCSKTDTKKATANPATYNCSAYPGYTLSGTNCVKKTTDTKKATANPVTYTCSIYGSDYKLSGKSCIKSYQTKLTENAAKNPTTYTCDSYGKDYKLTNNKCVKTTTEKTVVDAKKVSGGYVCSAGYKLNGTKCEKTITSTDKKNATEVIGKTYCPTGYKMDGNKCVKTTEQEIKTTYYRYATRSCTGASTDIKWSSNNDKTLLNAGYKLTGKKRAITVSK